MIGAFANGLILTFLPAILYPLLGNLGFANTTFLDADFVVLGIIFRNYQKILLIIVILVILLILILLLFNLVSKKEVKNN